MDAKINNLLGQRKIEGVSQHLDTRDSSKVDECNNIDAGEGLETATKFLTNLNGFKTEGQFLKLINTLLTQVLKV